MAQRLCVSRAHIRRLLDRGHENGMLTRRDDGTVLRGESMR
jgi:DNA-binding transcriptional regulator LsrR (DeoR family)